MTAPWPVIKPEVKEGPEWVPLPGSPGIERSTKTGFFRTVAHQPPPAPAPNPLAPYPDIDLSEGGEI